MKKSLGSFLFFIILLSTSINASTYKWSSYVAKEKAYVGESVYVKYLCKFDDNGELYIIDFEPRSSDLYDLILLSKDEILRDGKRTNTYEYILKVKSPQDFEMILEATMKKTSLDSIVENTTNHYDDTKFDSIHTKNIVKMDKISLEVFEAPKKLLGRFDLQVKKDASDIKAYEPYHLELEVSGEGNFEALQALEFDIENVKVFAQKPIKSISLDKDGYKGSWNQQFAFVSSEDFRIPARSIDYFDIASQEIKSLHMEAIHVKVQQAYKKSELLDEVEEGFIFEVKYIYYILTFIVGFFLGKINFTKKKVSTKDQSFIRKVKKLKSLDELSILLLMSNERRYDSVLAAIEANELSSLSQAKKMIMKLV